MTRSEFPRKVKAAAAFRANGCCEQCHAKLKTGEAEYDHVLPCALGGEPTLENCQVLCRVCHRGKDGKTATDTRMIRKADRQRAKHTGAAKKKRTIGYRRFDGTPVYPER